MSKSFEDPEATNKVFEIYATLNIEDDIFNKSDIDMIHNLIYKIPPNDINKKNNDGDTILIIASSFSHFYIVKALIDRCVDVNVTDRDGNNALMSLMYIIRAYGLDHINYNDYCCDTGKVIEYLIDAGIDTNTINNYGNTALLILSMADNKGRSDINWGIDYLVNYGNANIELSCNDKYTPLMHNLEMLNISFYTEYDDYIFKMLINDKNVNFQNKNGYTALSILLYPISEFNQEGIWNISVVNMVKILLENNADPNIQIYESLETSLHLAIQSVEAYDKGDVIPSIKLLLEYGADPAIKDGDGNNALQMAYNFKNSSNEYEMYQVINLLKEHMR